MNWSQKLVSLVLNCVKLVLIFAVCLIVAVVGGYLLAIPVGLIPESSEYYRPLSINTVLNDIPFIGTNMVYIIAFLLLLVIIYVSFSWYERSSERKSQETEKQAKASPQQQDAKQ